MKTTHARIPSSRRTLAIAIAVAALTAAFAAPAARADFGIAPGSFVAKTHAPVPLLPTGNNIVLLSRTIDLPSIVAAPPITQAGAHPDATTSFSIPASDDQTKDVVVSTPPGFIGDPQAVPACDRDSFARWYLISGNVTPLSNGCSPVSQVGVAHVDTALGKPATPIYLLTRSDGLAASFGFGYDGQGIVLNASVRSDGDYGLNVSSSDIAGSPPLQAVTVTLWGVPADPVHDPDRYDPTTASWGASSDVAPTPFLANPTWCDSGPLNTSISMDSWQAPDVLLPSDPLDPDYNAASPQPTGCDQLSFGGPSAPVGLTFQPTVQEADSPSGYDVKLTLPYNDNPDGLANPELRDAQVTLPPGVVVNPASANGLGSCGTQQIGFAGSGFPEPAPLHFTGDSAQCPDSSKIGTVEIHTPLLDHPLDGAVYLASQGDNPFHSLLAIYIAVNDPATGIVIKLAGKVTPDAQTGRLTSTFENNPQLPFTELDLHFFGGPHAPLTTPASCGKFTTNSVLTPWSAPESGPPATTSDSFTLDQNCASGGFAPQLSAGVTNPVAGSSSSFVMQLTRADGEQNIAGLDMSLPPGVLAKLAGVPLCPDADAASGNCPASSQVGHTTVAVGVGPNPLSIPQAGKAPTAVYLAGAYKGAPYSLVIKVPAQAGPFDLGVVTVRAGIYVDPTTAQVTVKSDPLPQILQGIPVQYRDLRVMIDRPGFMQAPTSCNPMQISARVISAGASPQIAVNGAGAGYSTSTGAVANLTDRFQVGDCANLVFSPKLKVALSGKGKTRSGDHPTLTARLTQRSGQANIRSARVALPLSLALDVNNSKNVCNYQVAQAVHGGPVACPAGTIVGRATAVTPLLSQPLTGPVYLVQGIRFGKNGQPIHTLPSLLIPLRGQIALDLRAQSAVSGGKLVTTFATIPDAPVSKFTLKINGGRKGILVITGRGKTICGKKQMTKAKFGAQSGKSKRSAIKMSTPCRATKSKKKSKAKKGRPRKQAAGDVLLSPAVARLWGW